VCSAFDSSTRGLLDLGLLDLGLLVLGQVDLGLRGDRLGGLALRPAGDERVERPRVKTTSSETSTS
jgi:hypothetical protein